MRSILFLLLLPLPCFAQLCGKVVSVHDGDTFTLLVDGKRQVKVRLHGIDCPERGQAFGNAAREYVANLIAGRRVCIDSTDTDRYGRVIAIVPTPCPSPKGCPPTSINERLLADGLAWHYKKYDKNPEWAKLEDIARRNKKGLWQQPNPVIPWEWRKNKK